MLSFPLGFPLETIVVFIMMIIVAILIDFSIYRREGLVSLKNATMCSLLWILIAIIFTTFLSLHHGTEVASLFLTGYLLEEVLSVDNLFVIMAIFSWFKIPNQYRHRVLYFGILGAIIFRGIFIAIGTVLLDLGPYIEAIFALIISCTAVLMLNRSGENNTIEDYSNHIACRLVKRFYPVWPKISSNKFFLTQEEVNFELKNSKNQNLMIEQIKKSKYYATPLLLCLSAIEISDIIFAFDSVPSVISISRDPLISYSAIIFAIFSLRTFYFVLEVLRKYLAYLEKATVLLLFFVALKLLLNVINHFWHNFYEIDAIESLIVVFSILVLGIIRSIVFLEKKRANKFHCYIKNEKERFCRMLKKGNFH